MDRKDAQADLYPLTTEVALRVIDRVSDDQVCAVYTLECTPAVARARLKKLAHSDPARVIQLLGKVIFDPGNELMDITCSYCGAPDNGTCAYPSEGKPGCLLPANREQFAISLLGNRSMDIRRQERLRTMQFNTHLRGTPIIVRVYAAQIVQPFVLEIDVLDAEQALLPWVLEPDELAALCGQIARHSFGSCPPAG